MCVVVVADSVVELYSDGHVVHIGDTQLVVASIQRTEAELFLGLAFGTVHFGVVRTLNLKISTQFEGRICIREAVGKPLYRTRGSKS